MLKSTREYVYEPDIRLSCVLSNDIFLCVQSCGYRLYVSPDSDNADPWFTRTKISGPAQKSLVLHKTDNTDHCKHRRPRAVHRSQVKEGLVVYYDVVCIKSEIVYLLTLQTQYSILCPPKANLQRTILVDLLPNGQINKF